MARPQFKALLFDLPSDHEVEGGIATECQMIGSLLANNGVGSLVKTVRATTPGGLYPKHLNQKPYEGINVVHIATHGIPQGISLIGGDLFWEEVAERLRIFIAPLKFGQKRILCLSCCHSSDGAFIFSKFPDLFSGIYYFNTEEIDFSVAMTVWAMVYSRLDIEKPGGKIKADVNSFFPHSAPLAYRKVGIRRAARA